MLIYYFTTPLELTTLDDPRLHVGAIPPDGETCEIGVSLSTERDMMKGLGRYIYEVAIPAEAVTTLSDGFLKDWERTRDKAGRTGGNAFSRDLHASLKEHYQLIHFTFCGDLSERALLLDVSCVKSFRKVYDPSSRADIAPAGAPAAAVEAENDLAASGLRPRLRA